MSPCFEVTDCKTSRNLGRFCEISLLINVGQRTSACLVNVPYPVTCEQIIELNIQWKDNEDEVVEAVVDEAAEIGEVDVEVREAIKVNT